MQETMLRIIEEDSMVERSVKRCERWLREYSIKDPVKYKQEFADIKPDNISLQLHSIRYILSEFHEENCNETIRITLSVWLPDQREPNGRYNCYFNLYGGLDGSAYRSDLPRQ